MISFKQYLMESSEEDNYKIASNKRTHINKIDHLIDNTTDEEVYQAVMHNHPNKMDKISKNPVGFTSIATASSGDYRDTLLHKIVQKTDSPEVLDDAFERFKTHHNPSFRYGLYLHIINHPHVSNETYDKVDKLGHSDPDILSHDEYHGDLFGYRTHAANIDSLLDGDKDKFDNMYKKLNTNHKLFRHIMNYGTNTEQHMLITGNRELNHDEIDLAIEKHDDTNSSIPHNYGDVLTSRQIDKIISKKGEMHRLPFAKNFKLHHLVNIMGSNIDDKTKKDTLDSLKSVTKRFGHHLPFSVSQAKQELIKNGLHDYAAHLG